MPYCVHCGNQVQAEARFCAVCGTAQASSTPPPPPNRPPQPAAFAADAFPGLDSRTASILCYIPILGWIPSIFVLASDKFRNDTATRFHAFQGLYLFVAWMIVSWVLDPLGRHTYWVIGINFAKLLKGVLLGAWLFMMFKVSQRESFKLPLVGDWAERSVSEQR